MVKKRQVGKLFFVTTNRNKFREVQEILRPFGIKILHKDLELLEIQCPHTETVARIKANDAYTHTRAAVLVDDTALFVKSLNGFPGVYAAHAYKTLGLYGFIKLMRGVKDRAANFVTTVAFKPNPRTIMTFKGDVAGKISGSCKGKKWGYDPIFIPEGFMKTYAQMTPSDKNRISHRRKAFEAFANFFIEYYVQKE